MDKIASFKIDHTKLKPGIYVSRVDDCNGCKVTTFDLRMTQPYIDVVMDTASVHAIEHLGATWLRNSDIQDSVIYFGPMGCRTGFYLILKKFETSESILFKMIELFEFIVSYRGDIPGASMKDCGNYTDMDLEGAKVFARLYLDTLHYIKEHDDLNRLHYAEEHFSR